MILCEGQTEERFVKDLLSCHLGQRGLPVSATLICTKRDAGRRAFRGGHAGRYELIRNDLLRFLKSDNGLWVTTLLDYYGLPSDFPGQGCMPAGDCFRRVCHLEDAFGRDIGYPERFLPNLVLHEFEGLLFTDPEAIQAALPGEDLLADLQAIARSFDSPEEINDSPQTAPSKRLLSLSHNRYQKPLHGARIAAQIGLPSLRERCRHFDAWMTRLENLAASNEQPITCA